MITEKELLTAVVGYSILQKEEDRLYKEENEVYDKQRKLEKIIKRGLAERTKPLKYPRSISIKVGSFKVSQSLYLSHLRVKPIKR